MLSEMEGFSLTYSCFVLSYSKCPKSLASNDFSLEETSNTNKRKLSTQSCRPIEHSFRKNCNKKFKQIIAQLVKFQMGLTKKTMLSLKKVALKSTLNKFITINLAMIPIVLIRIRKYFLLLWKKNKILMTLPMKASHFFKKLHFGHPENLQ